MINFEKIFEKEYPVIAQQVLSVQSHERLQKFAELLGVDLKEAGQQVSKLSGAKFYEKFSLNDEIVKHFPVSLITGYKILPFTSKDDELVVLACWPLSDEQIRWIGTAIGGKVGYCLGYPENILEPIAERFGLGVDSSGNFEDPRTIQATEQDDNAVVIRFVNELIKRCIHERATDIHFEPQRENLFIRYRVDGELVVARVPDNLKNFQSAIISRLKIMARLNISEKRLPQDGKILFKNNDELIDIRVSILPVVYGESVSLRLLNNSFAPKKIKEIFLNAPQRALLEHALISPYGIILVTGPTGSGKSTTLSACLRAIQTTTMRLMTVEDPIEYEIPGVNQTQVNPAIGLTFGNILRAILRQDPDIIMIGEIRDRETADSAIRASITGHLVLSTLHTNDAAGAITRLRDIGVEKFLLASAVRLVIAQRLVRHLCPYCAVPEDFSQFSREEAERIFGTTDFGQAHRPHGCEHCNNTGFFGRIGIFEFMDINNTLREAISNGQPESDIRSIARTNGMHSLKIDVLRNIRTGITSISEALKVIEH